jgi:catechol 2,3-dioxygenase-like lactoylglutathione lyase family enzyme
LLEPLHPDTPVGRFLERRGEGVHHIGYGVADIEAAMSAMSEAGLRLLDRRPRHGSMGASIAFLHPGDIGGVLTELVQFGGIHPVQAGQEQLIRELGDEQPRTRPQHRDTGVRCHSPGNVNWPAGTRP